MVTSPYIKKHYTRIKYQKLVLVSVLIGFLSALLALILKRMTEHYETLFLNKGLHNGLYFLLFPIVGLTLIYFLRQYLFRKKENKGIREIFETIAQRRNSLPIYKIPSHFINGFITVIFGGSTGIEVSTVVATATIGSVAQKKDNVFNQHKTELICAGVAAGITALFFSPVAGLLFATEVLSKKITTVFVLVCSMATAVAWSLLLITDEKPLFTLSLHGWHWHALPYFVLLGILSGMHSVYLTKCVLYVKRTFTTISKYSHKILLGAAILSLSTLLLPQLYGEGYHAIKDSLLTANHTLLTLSLTITVLGILVLKPIVTSVTLASGGDGGVFAPSLFLGGFIGLLLALYLNAYWNADVIVINFMLIGMGAMLSASINAPFTALFLVCGLINNYTLCFPLLLSCLVAKFTAQALFPFTVYTFKAAE